LKLAAASPIVGTVIRCQGRASGDAKGATWAEDNALLLRSRIAIDENLRHIVDHLV